MFNKLLRTSLPANYFFIPVFVLLGTFTVIYNIPDTQLSNNNSILFSLINAEFSNIFVTTIYIITVITISLILISFTSKYFSGIVGSVFPSLLFIVFSNIIFWIKCYNIYIIALFPLVFVVKSLFNVYHKNRVYSNLFNAGFLSGIMFLINSNFAIVLLYCWVTVVLLRQFKLREFFTVLIGFVAPILILHSILFVIDKDIVLYIAIDGLFSVNYAHFNFVIKDLVLIILFTIFLFSALEVLLSGIINKIATRRYFLSFTILFVLFVFSYIYLFSVATIIIMLVPLSFITAFAISTIRSKYAINVITLLLLFSEIIIQLMFWK